MNIDKKAVEILNETLNKHEHRMADALFGSTELMVLYAINEAINYTRCSTELRGKEDTNYKFNEKDFKYSKFIQGVGKEYNYISNKAHYFINGTLTKILNP